MAWFSGETEMTEDEIPGVWMTSDDANNYSKIPSILGMEEEGDPVGEIMRLKTGAPTVADAISVLKNAFKKDPMFAWTWHCALVILCMDNTGAAHLEANNFAIAFMKTAFGVVIQEVKEDHD
jgi:hypothetical protein